MVQYRVLNDTAAATFGAASKYTAATQLLGTWNLGSSAGNYARNPSNETFAQLAVDTAMFAAIGGGGPRPQVQLGQTLAFETSASWAVLQQGACVGIGVRSGFPVLFAETGGDRGQPIPRPPGSTKRIPAIGGDIEAFSGADPSTYPIGVSLARRAKAYLGLIRDDLRGKTTIAVVQIGEREIVAISGAGRDYRSGLERDLRELGINARVINAGPGQHAEEALMFQYRSRFNAMGVSHAAGPCLTTGRNCTDMFGQNSFHSVYWDPIRSGP